MSEIRNPLVVRNRIEVGSSRPGTWQTVRLVVHRNSSDWLTAALIETSWQGSSALDSRLRGGQLAWDPAKSDVPDLRLYALSCAVSAFAQTGR
jgi:hypothetical protein